MYAVVEYEHQRKEQSFWSNYDQCWRRLCKKVAFQYAANDTKMSRYGNDSVYRITTKVENEYLTTTNKAIISYKVINLEKYKE